MGFKHEGLWSEGYVLRRWVTRNKTAEAEYTKTWLCQFVFQLLLGKRSMNNPFQKSLHTVSRKSSVQRVKPASRCFRTRVAWLDSLQDRTDQIMYTYERSQQVAYHPVTLTGPW